MFLLKEGNLHTGTHGIMLWEDKAEVEALCLQVNECQGLPVTTSNWGGAWTWSFSEPSVKTNPTDNLTSHFQPPELWGSTFPLFWATQFVVVYYGRPRKLTHFRKNLVYYILEQGCLVKFAWWSNSSLSLVPPLYPWRGNDRN